MAHVVNLLGGTGNQLFEYLFGETVQALTGEEVAYDAGDFASYMLHGGFSLTKVLDVDPPMAANPRAPWLRHRRAKRLLSELPSALRRSLGFHTDRDFSFADLPRLGRNQYFYGFWQGIDYPLDLATEIISRLRFRPAVNEQAQATTKRLGIDPANDIALHVRLGDYLKLPRSPHLPLPGAYYRQVVADLARDGASGRVWVFSDDIALCQTMFAAEGEWRYVEGQSAGADLCLMATMNTVVISASTFGWWAGALTASVGKRVIYPHPWVKPAFAGEARLSPPPLPGWTLAASNVPGVADR